MPNPLKTRSEEGPSIYLRLASFPFKFLIFHGVFSTYNRRKIRASQIVNVNSGWYASKSHPYNHHHHHHQQHHLHPQCYLLIRKASNSRVLKKSQSSDFFFFFCFLGPHLQHMEVPRLEAELEPQQRGIQATSATYNTAHGNTRSPTH